MGRRSREMRRKWQERLNGKTSRAPGGGPTADSPRTSRIAELMARLKRVTEGEFELGGCLSPEAKEAHLEDILAFESVSTGTSLFQGLEQHAVKLPRPESLDEHRD
ncbi:MAG TPA: hypothetical protein VE398_23605 [Acidobacteriota bacterium]|nr:hypothetical protein [Acidobacteriota bacterium]